MGFELNKCYHGFKLNKKEEIVECFRMITTLAAKLLRLDDYGLVQGTPADLVILNCTDRATAISELAQPLYGFKRGRLTFSNSAAHINYP